jgi:hypothetical protein
MMKQHDATAGARSETRANDPSVDGRLLDVGAAARYLATSRNTVQRLIYSGALPVVRLPVQRTKHGLDPGGLSRRVLIDVRDLDALIDQHKEIRGDGETTPLPRTTVRRR